MSTELTDLLEAAPVAASDAPTGVDYYRKQFDNLRNELARQLVSNAPKPLESLTNDTVIAHLVFSMLTEGVSCSYLTSPQYDAFSALHTIMRPLAIELRAQKKPDLQHQQIRDAIANLVVGQTYPQI